MPTAGHWPVGHWTLSTFQYMVHLVRGLTCKRVLRRSADGPEPGRGQGLGAPWTPALRTRCEPPGREYRVPDDARTVSGESPPYVRLDYFGLRASVRGCETSHSRSVLVHGRHSLARTALRPPSRCAISKQSRARERAGEDTATPQAAPPIRSRGAAAERDRAGSSREAPVHE
ncbi:hypothetical protein ACJJTC_007487 [Scirpophaga incertulas]